MGAPRRKRYIDNIDINSSSLVLVFTVAIPNSYILNEWDLSPYNSVTARQSLSDLAFASNVFLISGTKLVQAATAVTCHDPNHKNTL